MAETESQLSVSSAQLLSMNQAGLNEILTGKNITADTPKIIVGYLKRFMFANLEMALQSCLLIFKHAKNRDQCVSMIDAGAILNLIKCIRKYYNTRSDITEMALRALLALFGEAPARDSFLAKNGLELCHDVLLHHVGKNVGITHMIFLIIKMFCQKAPNTTRMVDLGIVEACIVGYDFYFGKDNKVIRSLMGVLALLSEVDSGRDRVGKAGGIKAIIDSLIFFKEKDPIIIKNALAALRQVGLNPQGRIQAHDLGCLKPLMDVLEYYLGDTFPTKNDKDDKIILAGNAALAPFAEAYPAEVYALKGVPVLLVTLKLFLNDNNNPKHVDIVQGALGSLVFLSKEPNVIEDIIQLKGAENILFSYRIYLKENPSISRLAVGLLAFISKNPAGRSVILEKSGVPELLEGMLLFEANDDFLINVASVLVFLADTPLAFHFFHMAQLYKKLLDLVVRHLPLISFVESCLAVFDISLGVLDKPSAKESEDKKSEEDEEEVEEENLSEAQRARKNLRKEISIQRDRVREAQQEGISIKEKEWLEQQHIRAIEREEKKKENEEKKRSAQERKQARQERHLKNKQDREERQRLKEEKKKKKSEGGEESFSSIGGSDVEKDEEEQEALLDEQNDLEAEAEAEEDRLQREEFYKVMPNWFGMLEGILLEEEGKGILAVLELAMNKVKEEEAAESSGKPKTISPQSSSNWATVLFRCLFLINKIADNTKILFDLEQLKEVIRAEKKKEKKKAALDKPSSGSVGGLNASSSSSSLTSNSSGSGAPADPLGNTTGSTNQEEIEIEAEVEASIDKVVRNISSNLLAFAPKVLPSLCGCALLGTETPPSDSSSGGGVKKSSSTQSLAKFQKGDAVPSSSLISSSALYALVALAHFEPISVLPEVTDTVRQVVELAGSRSLSVYVDKVKEYREKVKKFEEEDQAEKPPEAYKFKQKKRDEEEGEGEGEDEEEEYGGNDNTSDFYSQPKVDKPQELPPFNSTLCLSLWRSLEHLTSAPQLLKAFNKAAGTQLLARELYNSFTIRIRAIQNKIDEDDLPNVHISPGNSTSLITSLMTTFSNVCTSKTSCKVYSQNEKGVEAIVSAINFFIATTGMTQSPSPIARALAEVAPHIVRLGCTGLASILETYMHTKDPGENLAELEEMAEEEEAMEKSKTSQMGASQLTLNPMTVAVNVGGVEVLMKVAAVFSSWEEETAAQDAILAQTSKGQPLKPKENASEIVFQAAKSLFALSLTPMAVQRIEAVRGTQALFSLFNLFLNKLKKREEKRILEEERREEKETYANYDADDLGGTPKRKGGAKKKKGGSRGMVEYGDAHTRACVSLAYILQTLSSQTINSSLAAATLTGGGAPPASAAAPSFPLCCKTKNLKTMLAVFSFFYPQGTVAKDLVLKVEKENPNDKKNAPGPGAGGTLKASPSSATLSRGSTRSSGRSKDRSSRSSHRSRSSSASKGSLKFRDGKGGGTLGRNGPIDEDDEALMTPSQIKEKKYQIRRSKVIETTRIGRPRPEGSEGNEEEDAVEGSVDILIPFSGILTNVAKDHTGGAKIYQLEGIPCFLAALCHHVRPDEKRILLRERVKQIRNKEKEIAAQAAAAATASSGKIASTPKRGRKKSNSPPPKTIKQEIPVIPPSNPRSAKLYHCVLTILSLLSTFTKAHRRFTANNGSHVVVRTAKVLLERWKEEEQKVKVLIHKRKENRKTKRYDDAEFEFEQKFHATQSKIFYEALYLALTTIWNLAGVKATLWSFENTGCIQFLLDVLNEQQIAKDMEMMKIVFGAFSCMANESADEVLSRGAIPFIRALSVIEADENMREEKTKEREEKEKREAREKGEKVGLATSSSSSSSIALAEAPAKPSGPGTNNPPNPKLKAVIERHFGCLFWNCANKDVNRLLIGKESGVDALMKILLTHTAAERERGEEREAKKKAGTKAIIVGGDKENKTPQEEEEEEEQEQSIGVVSKALGALINLCPIKENAIIANDLDAVDTILSLVISYFPYIAPHNNSFLMNQSSGDITPNTPPATPTKQKNTQPSFSSPSSPSSPSPLSGAPSTPNKKEAPSPASLPTHLQPPKGVIPYIAKITLSKLKIVIQSLDTLVVLFKVRKNEETFLRQKGVSSLLELIRSTLELHYFLNPGKKIAERRVYVPPEKAQGMTLGGGGMDRAFGSLKKLANPDEDEKVREAKLDQIEKVEKLLDEIIMISHTIFLSICQDLKMVRLDLVRTGGVPIVRASYQACKPGSFSVTMVLKTYECIVPKSDEKLEAERIKKEIEESKHKKGKKGSPLKKGEQAKSAVKITPMKKSS